MLNFDYIHVYIIKDVIINRVKNLHDFVLLTKKHFTQDYSFHAQIVNVIKLY